MPPTHTRRKRRRSWKRQLRRPWVILLIASALLAGGFYFFTGWRARDLAGKARENFERGNYRMAWLQLRSARELRSGDAEVLRTTAMLETKFGRPEALETFQKLESRGALREEDLETQARTALRFGSEEEFEAAVQKLEAMGDGGEAVPLRAARAALRGDLDRALSEARRAAATPGKPEAKLELARLLALRHGHVLRTRGRPAAEDVPALREIGQIIDSLQSTTLSEPALAFGLGTAAADPETKKKWAVAGMKNVSPSNPALLPAAEFLVRSGAARAIDLHVAMRPAYDTAPLAQRADFALWLSRQGLPKEGLALLTAQEAADDLSAFLARTDALARLSNWQGVLETAEAAEKVPASMRELTRVWTLTNSDDRLAMGPALTRAVGTAVQAAAREKKLRPMLASLDSIGVGTVADAELGRLCSDPGTADAAFSLLRERLGRTEGTAALEPAYESAKKAAPDAPSVLDHGRYLELFGSLRLQASETAAAIASSPAEIPPRVTHALFMLRRNDPVAAKATFDDVTVFFDEMLPAHQVVVAAFTGGTGDTNLARMMRGAIKTDILTPGEKGVLDQWVPPEGNPASP
ncbi:MAG: hypothetical protein WEC73_03995 [Chthoniobacterales bacterium]